MDSSGRAAVIAAFLTCAAAPLAAQSAKAYEALVAEAVADARSGQAERAETVLGRAVAMDPNRPEAHLERGGVRFAQRRYEEALPDVRFAVQRSPDPFGRNLLASTLFLLGRTDEALDEWNRLGQPRVRSIQVKGIERVPEDWLRRELTFEVGERLDRDDLRASRRRIRESGLFRNTDFRLLPDGENVDVTIQTRERHGLSDNKLEFIGSTLAYAANKKVFLRYANILHSGVTARGRYRWEPARPLLSLDLQWTRPFGLPAHLFAEVVRREQPYDLGGAFSMRSLGLEAGLRRVIGPATVVQGSFRTRDLTSPQDQPLSVGKVQGVRALVEHHWVETSRHQLRTTAEYFLASDALGSDVSYQRELIGLFHAWTLSKPEETAIQKSVLASAVRWGYTSAETRIDDLFAPGAASDMEFPLRGHKLRRHGVMGETPIGRSLWLGNAEYRQRLWSRPRVQVGGVVFYDVARVQKQISGEDSFLHDVGLGLRLGISESSILRADWGYSLNNDSKNALTVGFDQAF